MDAQQIVKYKEQLGKIGASLVSQGMKVGLGSGSTAA